jgi:hypothetical protein
MKNKEVKSVFSSMEHFSSTPPPELWDTIAAQLDKPKKKKRPLVWWWVAAGLVAGLSISNFLYFNSNQGNVLELNMDNTNGVVLQKDQKENAGSKNNTLIIESKILESDETNKEILKESINRKSNAEKVSISLNNNTVAEKNSFPILSNENIFWINKNLKNVNETQSTLRKQDRFYSDEVVAIDNSVVSNSDVSSIVSVNKGSKKNNLNKDRVDVILNKNIKPKINTEKTSIYLNTTTTTVAVKNSSTILSKTSNSWINNNLKNKKETQSTLNDKSVSAGVVSISNAVVSNSEVSSVNTAAQKNNFDKVRIAIVSTGTTTGIALSSNKESISNTNSKTVEIDKNNNFSKSNSTKAVVANTNNKDSLATIKKELAQLESALADLDNKNKTTKKNDTEVIDKWSLQVFAGVMSSDNFSNDKALGNAVASKQSNGYGVKTNYKLTKKWAVSSGFKINELGQKIAGVSYYERSGILNTPSGTLPIITNDFEGSNFTKNNAVVLVSTNENYLFASNSKSASGFETGNVTQNLRYFEMPIEVSYALLSKKKTNISMNTGGFVGKLISNEVLLNDNSIGENNNVKDYVYGTSLSSTLQYEIYKKTKFFIEPGMNYYINPLENQSFNQFQWMFNVGVNVSF